MQFFGNYSLYRLLYHFSVLSFLYHYSLLSPTLRFPSTHFLSFRFHLSSLRLFQSSFFSFFLIPFLFLPPLAFSFLFCVFFFNYFTRYVTLFYFPRYLLCILYFLSLFWFYPFSLHHPIACFSFISLFYCLLPLLF